MQVPLGTPTLPPFIAETIAAVESRGYQLDSIAATDRRYVARATKVAGPNTFRAEALGRDMVDAARRLQRVVLTD